MNLRPHRLLLVGAATTALVASTGTPGLAHPRPAPAWIPAATPAAASSTPSVYPPPPTAPPSTPTTSAAPGFGAGAPGGGTSMASGVQAPPPGEASNPGSPSGAAGDGSPPPLGATSQVASSSGRMGGGEGGPGAWVREGAAATSDHDLVAGGWGLDVTPIASRLDVFARRPTTGCPLAPPTPASTIASTSAADCPLVTVSALGLRHGLSRSWAIDVGLAFALGGGRDHGRLLDTTLAIGPVLGVSLLIANWKHLAILASPGASLVLFRAAQSVDTSSILEFHADLESEIHFGFWGLPALSLSARSGLGLRLERAADVTQWTMAPTGPTTLASVVNDLSLRYYF